MERIGSIPMKVEDNASALKVHLGLRKEVEKSSTPSATIFWHADNVETNVLAISMSPWSNFTNSVNDFKHTDMKVFFSENRWINGNIKL